MNLKLEEDKFYKFKELDTTTYKDFFESLFEHLRDIESPSKWHNFEAFLKNSSFCLYHDGEGWFWYSQNEIEKKFPDKTMIIINKDTLGSNTLKKGEPFLASDDDINYSPRLFVAEYNGVYYDTFGTLWKYGKKLLKEGDTIILTKEQAEKLNT